MSHYISTALIIIFSVFGISCSKSDGEEIPSNLIGTWNEVAADVYFDGEHIQGVPLRSDAGVVLFDEDGKLGSDVEDEVLESQITFNANGTGTILFVTFKYKVKGNEVVIDWNSIPEAWADGLSKYETYQFFFTKDKLTYTITYKDVYEYYTRASSLEDMKSFGADGKKHVVKFVRTYKKQQ